MKEIWESRYAENEYVYGKEPNTYFKNFIDNSKPAKILLPAEGEGRNAVYAALKGWDVYAFDQSENAKDKALKLASEFGVVINYDVCDYASLNYPFESFDAIGIIYFHLPENEKANAFNHLFKFLKPNAKVILEVFDKEQIINISGGPKDIDLLYDTHEMEMLFNSFGQKNIRKENIKLDEGKLHQGDAIVIRVDAIK
jgi:ubiquinone/menaquinone biosynthesis C-methylase UbiE